MAPAAWFFFYTDVLKFSSTFLGTVGLVGSVCTLAGVYVFDATLKSVSFRTVLPLTSRAVRRMQGGLTKRAPQQPGIKQTESSRFVKSRGDQKHPDLWNQDVLIGSILCGCRSSSGRPSSRPCSASPSSSSSSAGT
jgi:hypothetical protein